MSAVVVCRVACGAAVEEQSRNADLTSLARAKQWRDAIPVGLFDVVAAVEATACVVYAAPDARVV